MLSRVWEGNRSLELTKKHYSLVRYILINKKHFGLKRTTLGTTFAGGWSNQITLWGGVAYRENSTRYLGIKYGIILGPRTRDPIGLRQGPIPFFFLILDFVTGGREIKTAFSIEHCSTVRMKFLPVGFGISCNFFNHKMKNHVTVLRSGRLY